MDVEMRHLRALVALAEELNFTRAAKRLHLTQQALSGQIRQLEARVGTQLVQRDTRHVALTAAGEALCERARALLSGAHEAVTAARAAGERRQPLVLGFVAPLTRRTAAPLFERLRTDHPEIELRIHFGSFLDPTGGLREGRCDVALLYGEFERTGIELRRLYRLPRGVLMAADHPLAGAPEITIEDFVAEPLVDVPIPDSVCRDFWSGARHRSGRPPRVGATVQTLDAMLEAVGAGLGVAATVEVAVTLTGLHDELVYRPLPELSPLDFWAACRAGDERPQVRAFMATAVVALGAPEDAAEPSGRLTGR